MQKIIDADVAAKKRKYSPSMAKWEVDKARSKMKVNLGISWLSSTEGEAGDEDRHVTQALACLLLDRKEPNTSG